MRILYTLILSAAVISSAVAQTKTTENLHKKNEQAFSLFFYKNTLRMLNQKDDKAFDELIKDVEKVKFLMIEKKNFTAADYNKLVSGYKSESFEEIMTSRFEGRNFDVFLKEKSGKTQGMIITANDSSSLIVLDIVGSVALNKVTSLFSQINDNSEIAQKIKAFTSDKDEKKK